MALQKTVRQPHTFGNLNIPISKDAINRYVHASLLDACNEIQRLTRRYLISNEVWWKANRSQKDRLRRAVKIHVANTLKTAQVLIDKNLINRDIATSALLFGTEERHPNGWYITPKKGKWLRWNSGHHIKTGDPYSVNDIFAKKVHHLGFNTTHIDALDDARSDVNVSMIFRENMKKLIGGYYGK